MEIVGERPDSGDPESQKTWVMYIIAPVPYTCPVISRRAKIISAIFFFMV